MLMYWLKGLFFFVCEPHVYVLLLVYFLEQSTVFYFYYILCIGMGKSIGFFK